MARSLRNWLGGCLLVSALGMVVPPPENVRMNSVNFKNILQWDSPAFPQGDLTFTAQYHSYRQFQDQCVSIILTECDFSSLSKYGDHILRVRAEFADEHSDWINITFCPVDDTIIGPPGMQVEALANSLHMRFLAPKIENEPETWTVRNIYNSWAYHVQYWKNGSDEKFAVTAQYDFEVLRNLESSTTYCVQVRAFLPDRNKTGEWSDPVCGQTTNDETTPTWIVACVLAASVVAAFLLLLGCFILLRCIYKKTKNAFPPRNSLPQHLKEFLSHPHHSTLLLFSIPLSDENEVFDKLSVITDTSESHKQNSGAGCSLGARCGQGSFELVSQEGAPSAGCSDPFLLTSASEDDQRDQYTRDEATPNGELSDTGTTSKPPKTGLGRLTR